MEPRSERPGTKEKAPTRSTGRLRLDLTAIGLCLLGALLGLALYRPGSAGGVGVFLVHFIRLWMGHVVYVAPLLFVAAGTMLAFDYRRATNAQMLWGTGLLLAVLFGWLHLMSTTRGLVFDSTAARFGALLGHPGPRELVLAPDGGLLGAVVMFLMFPLGRIGSFITLVAMAAAAALLITELTIRGIAERMHERSRIAAERARRTAGAVKARCQGSRLPVPVEGPNRNLFLDLHDDEEDEEPAPREKRSTPGLRSLFKKPETPAAEPEEKPVAATSAILAAEPEPEVVSTRPAGRSSAETRPRGKSFRPVRREAPAGDFVLPPLELLDSPPPRPKRPSQEADANIGILEGTQGQFRIEAQVVEIADGPSVTRYEIRLGEGIRVKKILDLADNIAMSLAAMSVRVEAPIPGKSAIGIEVPKKHAQVVTLKECLESDEARDLKSKVGFVLGKDVAGNVRCADLARMPHLLVAGATNSGKSVCLNALIASMLFRARPDEL
jgi:S-DNA-T family DNA segregation ATPase FtsK/SpoIIIE